MEGDVDFNRTAYYGGGGGHDTFKYSKNFHKQEELDLLLAIMLERQFVPNF